MTVVNVASPGFLAMPCQLCYQLMGRLLPYAFTRTLPTPLWVEALLWRHSCPDLEMIINEQYYSVNCRKFKMTENTPGEILLRISGRLEGKGTFVDALH